MFPAWMMCAQINTCSLCSLPLSSTVTFAHHNANEQSVVLLAAHLFLNCVSIHHCNRTLSGWFSWRDSWQSDLVVL